MVEEKDEDGLVGEEVEFLNTTVTVSRLPTVQFPEPAHKSKGTRLVDRWNNTANLGSSQVSFVRFEAAFFSLGSFAAEKPLPVILACSIFNIPYFNIQYLIFNIQYSLFQY